MISIEASIATRPTRAGAKSGGFHAHRVLGYLDPAGATEGFNRLTSGSCASPTSIRAARGPGGPGRATSDRFRLANRLEAWIEVQDGRVVDAGQAGDGRINVTKVGYGPASVAFTPGRPTRLAARTGDRAHLGAVCPNGRWSDRLSHPRRVRHEPYVQVGGPVTWTTLALTLHADGTAEPRLLGASFFPRHWVYDHCVEAAFVDGQVGSGIPRTERARCSCSPQRVGSIPGRSQRGPVRPWGCPALTDRADGSVRLLA
jgi:hypothetical protein